jgi:glycosyltransferase involved in cell wall biosynthesis
VTDLDYAKTLKSSFALVSASKDEGFGIPLVEAMAHGIPVVVSDIPIFREIAAQAGGYFDPMSPASFVAAVSELSKPGQWEAASAESLIRSRTFDWDESARVLIRALESI